MTTICILYGFCEGPRVARRFQRRLTDAGYNIIDDPAQADIIIGHSGGCFLLPTKIRARHIIQIGIPFWPNRSLAESIWRKFKTDLSNHHKEGAISFWLRKTFWNGLYFWNIPANIRMLQGRAKGDLWNSGAITTVVRPEHDTFLTPALNELPFLDRPKFVTVPGHHDECWRNPDLYISLLESNYGKRILAAPRGGQAVVPGTGVESARA